jgi:hypothetical protein
MRFIQWVSILIMRIFLAEIVHIEATTVVSLGVCVIYLTAVNYITKKVLYEYPIDC